jgi:hypothetical protein
MAIHEINLDPIREIPETTFSAAGLRERYDLQRLLRSRFRVVSPDTAASGVFTRISPRHMAFPSRTSSTASACPLISLPRRPRSVRVDHLKNRAGVVPRP